MHTGCIQNTQKWGGNDSSCFYHRFVRKLSSFPGGCRSIWKRMTFPKTDVVSVRRSENNLERDWNEIG